MDKQIKVHTSDEGTVDEGHRILKSGLSPILLAPTEKGSKARTETRHEECFHEGRSLDTLWRDEAVRRRGQSYWRRTSSWGCINVERKLNHRESRFLTFHHIMLRETEPCPPASLGGVTQNVFQE